MSNGKLVLNNKVKDEQDSEDAMVKDQNAGEYKGVFYGDNNEQRYYEHGAHFQFKDLCKRLEALLRTMSPSRRGNPNESNGT